ncbi:Sterile alpha motif (SAM) domain-containing protein [Thalictrum thalictroides]|uniref:Sterile alpha motif (SAM) domain-containing protein n=1 Tax=Thalictrum thalictroides TaxID=46969 RepID=A0A7J6V8Q5_THATH|nr:Sterile alpha motif (SAM) domain-containing protein [Thalictrum thalictroides]
MTYNPRRPFEFSLYLENRLLILPNLQSSFTHLVAENTSQPSGLSSKRQRRPSVRLGEIGDQPATLTAYDSYRRNKQLWNDSSYRFYSQKVTGKSSSLSKTRPLTNLGNNGSSHETLETQDNNNVDGDEGNLANSELLVSGNRGKGRDLKGKRGGGGTTKRVRTNWGSSKTTLNEVDVDDKFSGDDYYRDYDDDGERSESPLKEGSPIHSLENTNVDLHKDGIYAGKRRGSRGARVSESRDHGAVEMDVPSETDAREWKCRTSVDRISDLGRCPTLEEGVRMWLIGLGLGRYETIFEMHEVDEEVLPLLTLEDLKDMGINAVGSRRKLYSAIQKLGRGFS